MDGFPIWRFGCYVYVRGHTYFIMETLTIEELKIVEELHLKYGDIFYALIGANYLKGMDLSTNVWDCYNTLYTKDNGRK